jgi:tetratricopeptide (TPR) repeat protein
VAAAANLAMAHGHLFAVVGLLNEDHEGVISRLRPGCETLLQMGETGYLSTSAGYLARALIRTGELEEAERASSVSEASAASDDLGPQILWRGVRARVLAASGAHEDADRLGREAPAMAERTDDPESRGMARVDLAEVLRLSGRMDEANVHIREAIELYERKGNIVSANRARAELEKMPAGDGTHPC